MGQLSTVKTRTAVRFVLLNLKYLQYTAKVMNVAMDIPANTPPLWLAALSNSMASPPFTEAAYEHGQSAKLLQGSETTVGWISRNNLAVPVEADCFLDIPCYRTHRLPGLRSLCCAPRNTRLHAPGQSQNRGRGQFAVASYRPVNVAWLA